MIRCYIKKEREIKKESLYEICKNSSICNLVISFCNVKISFPLMKRDLN